MANFKPVNLDEIKYSPVELSEFWRRYFAELSIDFGRLFSRNTTQNITARYLHRDVIMLNEYMKSTSRSAIMQPFRINPENEIGFIYLTGDLCNALIHYMLGGSPNKDESVHYLTQFDEKLLGNILSEVTLLLERHLKKYNGQLSFEPLDPIHLNLMEVGIDGERLLSVQQFLLVTGQNTFVMDIAFSNKFLEGQVLI